MLASPYGGGFERPFDERAKPSPPLTLSPHFSSSSLPRGVNPAKRRQHQPIYTSCMQLLNAAPSPSLVLPPSLPPNTSVCTHMHTHTHASLFFVSWFVCMCAQWLHSAGLGIISATVKVKGGPAQGWQHLPNARCWGATATPHTPAHVGCTACPLRPFSLCIVWTKPDEVASFHLFSEWRFLLWLLDKIPQLKNTGLIHPSLYLNCNYSKMPNCFGFACMRACVSVCADISDIILVFLNCPDKLMRERLSQDRSNQSSLQVINNLTNRMNEWMRLHLPPSCDGNCKMCFLFIIANIFEAILS